MIKKAVLVVGGGVSGLEAALELAGQGIKTVLVEKDERLGGVARNLIATWKGEPVGPYLEALIKKVTHNDLVDVYVNTRVDAATGTVGNFITTLKDEKSGVKRTVEHGAVILATGGTECKPVSYSYGKHENILTHLDMDRAFVADDARVAAAKSVVFIQCVESRDNERPYCSKVCCTHSLKSAVRFKDRNPKTRVYILYRDIRSYGFREAVYEEARRKGVLFIRYDLENPPAVAIDRDNSLKVSVMDHVLKMEVTIHPDLMVLASGIDPGKNEALFEKYKVPVNSEGFLVEAHAKLRPVESASDGVFIAGLAHYPKPLEESIAQAKAAVSRAMTIVSKDAIKVGGIVAKVNDQACAACLTCVRICPYGVPAVHPDGYAAIDEAECHGCGVCVSECPAKAINLNHFTDEQIKAKTDALFETA